MVMSYLDSFDEYSLSEVDFVYKGHAYRALSDILFVIK